MGCMGKPLNQKKQNKTKEKSCVHTGQTVHWAMVRSRWPRRPLLWLQDLTVLAHRKLGKWSHPGQRAFLLCLCKKPQLVEVVFTEIQALPISSAISMAFSILTALDSCHKPLLDPYLPCSHRGR